MPGVIDLWDLLPIYLFEIRNTEKRKRNPSKREINLEKKLDMS